MDSFEDRLQGALERVRSWSAALKTDSERSTREILDETEAEYKTVPSCPSRGAMAQMCLSGIKERLAEVQAAAREVEDLLLDPRAPWNTAPYPERL